MGGGFRQVEIARMVGVSRPCVAEWESGALAIPERRATQIREAIRNRADALRELNERLTNFANRKMESAGETPCQSERD